MKYFILILLLLQNYDLEAQIYSSLDGKVEFLSEAPLEIISASSDELQGVLDISKKTFAFKIYIKSFDGFNSPLQKVHFYENYMEVDQFPIATFKGKILEPLQEGEAKYRAKGVLEIHGVEVERIVEVSLDFSQNGSAQYYSTFVIPLEDYNIDLPRIVYQKISEEILLTVQGSLSLRE